MHSAQTQRLTRHALIYLVLIAGAAVMVMPFLWMLSTSFKDMGEVRAWPPTFFLAASR